MRQNNQTIYRFADNMHIKTCPILLLNGKLSRNLKKSNFLFQLKFQNLCEKMIQTVCIDISGLDMNRNPIGIAKCHYLNLNLKRDDKCIRETPLFLPDLQIQTAAIRIHKVVFSDYSVWKDHKNPVEQFPILKPLTSVLPEQHLREQYYRACSSLSDTSHNAYALHEFFDFWTCTCGSINWNNEKECHICGKPKKWIQMNLEKKNLQKCYDAYLYEKQESP